MAEDRYAYIIVGGGLAGASAVQGIRAVDAQGSILLIGGEEYLPYNRPPLTKQLWFGKKRVEDIFVNARAYYDAQRVDVLLVDTVVKLDAENRSVSDGRGVSFHFDKLLLATGGRPRPLDLPGGDAGRRVLLPYLDDYHTCRAQASAGNTAVVIGGGFIGSEIAAALNLNGLQVTLVFPEDLFIVACLSAGISAGYLAPLPGEGRTVARTTIRRSPSPARAIPSSPIPALGRSWYRISSSPASASHRRRIWRTWPGWR